MPKHTITYTWTDEHGARITKDVSITAGQSIVIDETIPDGSTDLLVAINFLKAKLQVGYIVCDKALTIETNDGTTPDDTIVLTANQPLVYVKDLFTLDGAAADNPFDVDVTGFYVTNASGANAQLKAQFLVDPT